MAKAKKKKVGRPSTGKKTQVMRVSEHTYKRVKSIKGKRTYDQAFDEVFEARKLIKEAKKVFVIDGKILEGFDLEQARLVASQFSSKKLRIFLDLGEDS